MVTLETKKGKVETLKSTLARLALFAGVTLTYSKLFHYGVDHTHEYCILNDIIGLKHQAKMVNKDNPCLIPVYIPEGYDEEIVDHFPNNHVVEIIDSFENGTHTYYAPFMGDIKEYQLNGERVEVYYEPSHGEKRLIRIFTKKNY